MSETKKFDGDNEALDVLDVLAQIGKIAKLSNTALMDAVSLASENPAKSKEICLTALAAISEVLQDVDMGSILYSRWNEEFSDDTYVMPPEIAGPHDRLVNEEVLKGRTIDTFAHSGFLIHGVPGTGKSSYFSYLKHVLGEKAIFVSADLNKITDSDDPATLLKDLFRSLERLGEKEGKHVILLMDEFQKLMSKYSKIHGASTSKQHNSLAGKHSSQTTEVHESNTREIDEKGDALLSALQSILSGSGIDGKKLKWVFTVATTNENDIPTPLIRGGRLEDIEVSPFRMQNLKIPNPETFGGCYEEWPDYLSYSDNLCKIMDLFMALCIQDKEESSIPVFAKMKADIEALFEKVKTDGFKSSLGTNYEILGRLFKYFFNFDLPEEFNVRKSRRKPLLFSTAASWSRESDFIHKLDRGPEYARMMTLTPEALLRFYRTNRNTLKNYEDAKSLIGYYLFPQLEGSLNLLKAKESGF